MTEKDVPEGDLRAEFRNLGDNLKAAFQAAWESDERVKLQEDIEGGLNDLGQALSQAAEDFANSPSGQQLKHRVEDFGERVRSGEVEDKVRAGLLSALQQINRELEKVAKRPPTEDEG